MDITVAVLEHYPVEVITVLRTGGGGGWRWLGEESWIDYSKSNSASLLSVRESVNLMHSESSASATLFVLLLSLNEESPSLSLSFLPLPSPSSESSNSFKVFWSGFSTHACVSNNRRRLRSSLRLIWSLPESISRYGCATTYLKSWLPSWFSCRVPSHCSRLWSSSLRTRDPQVDW